MLLSLFIYILLFFPSNAASDVPGNHEIQTKITMHANADIVWQYLTTFSNYPQWNPFIVAIDGQVMQGEQLKVTITPPDSDTMNFKAKLLVVKEKQELRWRGKWLIPGLFDGEHYFKILPQEDGSVEFIHGEIFSGLLAGIIFPKIESDTRAGFLAMNQQLKHIAESHNKRE